MAFLDVCPEMPCVLFCLPLFWRYGVCAWDADLLIPAHILFQLWMKLVKHDVYIVQVSENGFLQPCLIMVFNGLHNGAVLVGHHDGIFQAEG